MYVPKCLGDTSPLSSKYLYQGHNIQSQLQEKWGGKKITSSFNHLPPNHFNMTNNKLCQLSQQSVTVCLKYFLHSGSATIQDKDSRSLACNMIFDVKCLPPLLASGRYIRLTSTEF